jgi:hypothetical protein
LTPSADRLPTPGRRLVLCGALIFWLTGYWFANEGYTHRWLLGALVLPALLLNWRELLQLPRRHRWYIPLLALLTWQAAITTWATGSLLAVGGVADALAIVLLVLALHVLADTPGGLSALLLSIFVVAAVAMVYSLVVFYPMNDLSLAQERLRNTWVYRAGLNAVLTGMLAGLALIAGWITSAAGGGRICRAAVWVGIAVLAFALMATRSRGPLIATAAGGIVVLWRLRRAVVPGFLAAAVGCAAFVATYLAVGARTLATDLLGRGLTGRLSIWEVYLDRLQGLEWLWGLGRCAPLDTAVLGWHVHHPHSSLVAQLAHTGLVGTALLCGCTLWVLYLGLRRPHESAAPLALFVFGVVALLPDCSLPLSLFTGPRIEPLLVLVPAVFLLHRPSTDSAETGRRQRASGS